MAISNPSVVGGAFGNNVTTLSFHPSIQVPTNSILFLAVAGGLLPTSVSDSNTNTYLAAAETNEGGSTGAGLFVIQSTKQLKTTDTITVTFPSATNAAAGALFFTGAQNLVDSGSAGFGTGNPTGVACHANAGEMLIAAICVNGPGSDGFTQDANFSADFGSGISASNFSIHGGTRAALIGGTFVYQPTLLVPRPWIAVMASFK